MKEVLAERSDGERAGVEVATFFAGRDEPVSYFAPAPSSDPEAM